jgi:hypothetical protein
MSLPLSNGFSAPANCEPRRGARPAFPIVSGTLEGPRDESRESGKNETYNSRMSMSGWVEQAGTGRIESLARKCALPRWLLAALCASSAVSALAATQGKPAPAAPSPSAVSQPAAGAAIFNTVPSGREALLLRRRWGIDDLHVRYTASGQVIRFSYRVVDAQKAKVLNDKKTHPYLLVQKTGARLEVPTTEKVGQLRQTADPESGREYWMVFGNLGRAAKPGDHVNIVIGDFRANELVIESSAPAHRVQNP